MELRIAHPVGVVSHLRIVVSDLKIDNNFIKLNSGATEFTGVIMLTERK